MEFSTTRRITTTYGRPTKRVLVHNLFEGRTASDGVANIKTSARLSPPAVTPTTQTVEISIESQSSKTQVRISTSDHPKTYSRLAGQKHVSGNNSSSREIDDDVFALGSSGEDERHTAKASSKLSKKQRLTDTLYANHVANQRAAVKLAQTSRNVEQSSESLKSATRPDTKRQGPGTSMDRQPDRVLASAAFDTTATATAAIQRSHQNSSRARGLAKVKNPVSRIETQTREASLTKATGSVDHKSKYSLDSSPDSTTSTSAAVKRKRTPPPAVASEPPSPGLGLTPLRFASETSNSSTRSSSESPAVTGRKVTRTRPRLIDRLDAPSKDQQSVPAVLEASTEPDTVMVLSQPIVPERGRPKVTGNQKVQPLQLDSNAERSRDSQSRATYATKARTTYAKERSHLSDMVDGLDMSTAASSSQPQHGLAWRPPTSNLASRLDLNDSDSDDHSGPRPLTSIHELRQAGAMNRFEREVQALFEDIEVSQGKKKAARLSSLTKLAVRLSDEDFLRYFASSDKITRFTESASKIANVFEAIPYLIALYLVSRTAASTDTLTQVLTAVMKVTPRLLSAEKGIAELITERSSSTSKTDAKDLTSLERLTIKKRLIATYDAASIYPDGLALTCLEELLRKTMQLLGQGATLSVNVHSRILAALERYAKRLKAQTLESDHIQFIGKALSVLELCSLSLDGTDSSIEDEQYIKLGESLATIKQGSTDADGNIGRAVLRTVVSLSNNNADMCRLLGQTSIISTIIGAIDVDFGIIAEHAENQQEVDQGRLDSVILALGCLLNFAECDSSSRRSLAFGTTGSHSNVERLVTLFNSQIAKAEEVITPEEGQILVAFGYLSMLLCTMSLDQEVRHLITQRLKDRSFEKLCAAAELFFSHLRTLETISEDDQSMKSFTERFSIILKSIRG